MGRLTVWSLILAAVALAARTPTRTAEPELLKTLSEYEVVHVESGSTLLHENNMEILGAEWHAHDMHVSPIPKANSKVFHSFSFQLEDGFQASAVLEHNVKLFAPSYKEQRLSYKDGVLVARDTNRHDARLSTYKGHLIGPDGNKLEGSMVLASNKGDGFSGTIRHQDQNYRITPAAQHLSSHKLMAHKRRLEAGADKSVDLHIVFRAESQNIQGGNCGVDEAHSHVADGISTQGHSQSHMGLGHDHAAEFKSQTTARTGFQETSRNVIGKKTTPLSALKTAARQARMPLGIDPDKYTELLIANDKAYYTLTCPVADDSACAAQVEQQSADVTAMVAQYYLDAAFNADMYIVLIGQVTFTNEDPWAAEIPAMTDAQGGIKVLDLLNTWNDWRSYPQDPNNVVVPTHDNGHLISGLDFESSVVGYAGVGVMCTHSASGGINQWNGGQTGTALTVAHELGHNFNMYHDSVGNNCAQSGFIMNAVMTGTPPSAFSGCSVTSYEGSIDSRDCLNNEPTERWGVCSTPEDCCPNGFIDTGVALDGRVVEEECDPGSGTDTCCDVSSCKLTPQAQCPSTDPCCTDTCQLVEKSAAVVCRASRGPCDLAETCNGLQSTCPQDEFKGSGSECTDPLYGEGACYAGGCMSRRKQCMVEGSSYSGGPFTECAESSQQGYSDGYCAAILCKADGSSGVSCTTFLAGNGQSSDKKVQVADGVPCPGGKQCKEGACLSSVALNPHNSWVSGPWANCSSCDSVQSRPTNCVQLTQTGSETKIDDSRCSPGDRPPTTRMCIQPGLGCVHGERDNDLDKAARNLANKFNALNKAKQMRALIPRLYGPQTFDIDDTEYWKGIVMVGLLPLLITTVCILWAVAYYCTHHGCGALEPSAEGTSKSEKTIVWVVLIVCVAWACAFSCMGLFFNGEIRRGLNDQHVGIISILNQVVSTTIRETNKFEAPLNFIKLSEDAVITPTLDLLASVKPVLTAGSSVLVSMIDNFGLVIEADKTPVVIAGSGQANDVTVECTYVCDDAPARLAAVKTQIQQDVDPAFSQLDVRVNNAEESLIGLQANLAAPLGQIGSITQIQDRVNKTQESLEGQRVSITGYSTQMEGIDKARWPISLLILFLPWILLILTVLGLFLKSETVKKLMIHFSWIILVVFFLMLSLHLPLAATLGDTCIFMDLVEADLGKYMDWDAQQVAVLTACLSGQSLVAALNLTQSLITLETSIRITNNVSLPDAAVLNLTTLNTVSKHIYNDVNTSAWGWPVERVQGLLDVLNERTGGTACGGDLCTEFNIGSYSYLAGTDATANRMRDDVVTGILATREATDKHLAWKRNITAIEDYAASLQLEVEVIKGTLQTAQDTVQPLAEAVSNLRNGEYCTDMGEQYATFKDAWCSIVTTAISFLAFAFFMIAMAAAPTTYLAIRAWVYSKDIEGHHAEPVEMMKRKQRRRTRGAKSRKKRNRERRSRSRSRAKSRGRSKSNRRQRREGEMDG